jgi:hypothetical protein
MQDDDGEKRIWYPPLVHCDFCPCEAARDVWLRWGGKCPECKNAKNTLY